MKLISEGIGSYLVNIRLTNANIPSLLVDGLWEYVRFVR